MTNKKLIEYLNEFKAELQEMYDEFDHELSSMENHDMYTDAYSMVGVKLEDAINDIDSFIGDVDEGKYDGYSDIDDADHDYGGEA
jgi:hypothetical protein